jgi:hypothetical protein
LTVVILIGSEPAAFVIRRGRYPYVARSPLIEDPGYFTATRGGYELRSEGSIQVTFNELSAKYRTERQQTGEKRFAHEPILA